MFLLSTLADCLDLGSETKFGLSILLLPSLCRYVISSKLFLFFERNSLKLKCDTDILPVNCITIIVIKHVPFFTAPAKLTIGFTFTSQLPLKLCTTLSGCVRGFGFEQKN